MKINVARYDATARCLNAPLYAYYAEKIKALTGITSGLCLDAGSGGGYLGLALSRITDLEFIFMENSIHTGGGYQLFGTCVRKVNVLNEERLRQLGLDQPAAGRVNDGPPMCNPHQTGPA